MKVTLDRFPFDYSSVKSIKGDKGAKGDKGDKGDKGEDDGQVIQNINIREIANNMTNKLGEVAVEEDFEIERYFNTLMIDNNYGIVGTSDNNVVFQTYPKNLVCRTYFSSIYSYVGFNQLPVEMLIGDLSDEYNMFSVQNGGIIRTGERFGDYSYKFSGYVSFLANDVTDDIVIGIYPLNYLSYPVVMSKLIKSSTINKLKELTEYEMVKLYFETGNILPEEFPLDTIFMPFISAGISPRAFNSEITVSLVTKI